MPKFLKGEFFSNRREKKRGDRFLSEQVGNTYEMAEPDDCSLRALTSCISKQMQCGFTLTPKVPLIHLSICYTKMGVLHNRYIPCIHTCADTMSHLSAPTLMCLHLISGWGHLEIKVLSLMAKLVNKAKC